MTVVRIGQPERKRRSSFLRSRVTPASAALIIAAIVVLRLWVVETAIVDGHSMEDFLLPGDRVLVLKRLEPKRFDVVVLREPGAGSTAIKRVVGLPGDTLSMVPQLVGVGERQVALGSQLYIEGKPYEEPYASSFIPSSMPPIRIPAGAYFVLGDNRDASMDSRRYGPVKREHIRGVGVAVVYPLSRIRIIRQTPQAAAARGVASPR